MAIKATIKIDGDRWEKHPYGVSFDDEECDKKFHANYLDNRDECYEVIEKAREAGYDVDSNIDEYVY